MEARLEQLGNAVGVMETSPYVKWAIIHTMDFGGQVGQIAELFVTGVPPDASFQDVKDVIEDAGLFFGDGGIRWAGYTPYREEKWITGWQQEFTDPSKEKRAYEELLAMGRTDRRITLRLSPGTHVALVQAAKQRGISLNQIISDIVDEWQERHGQVEGTSLDEVETINKDFLFGVTQLMGHPIYFVTLTAKQPTAKDTSGALQKGGGQPKAIVEVREEKAHFAAWERAVPSGRFGEGALRLAVEGAVDRFVGNDKQSLA